MDAKSSQPSSIKIPKFKPEYLTRAAPLGIAVALAGASLLPMIRAGSPEMLMGGAILSGLGTDIIKDFIKSKILFLGKKSDEEILKETEDGILKLWNAPDEKGVKFRKELSQFLRQNGILQMALNDAPDEMKGALVESYAKLASEFEEFGWVLADIQKLLVEASAMVRHNVEISNEILTKVNLLAKIQRERGEEPTPPPAPIDEGETDDLPPADVPCPYKGLAAFQPQDVEYFYGREALTAQLLANLAGASFLAVVGPSGSGKSSLVRAGVIPALWKGEIPGSENWKTLIMRPGGAPLEELAVCVASESKSVASDLVEGLRKSKQTFRLEVKKYLLNQPEDAKFILVVDQFEEIFTQCKDENERGKFIAALMDAAQNGEARMDVILTLRADFYGHCASHPALAKLLSENQVLVGAMCADELRRAVNLPGEKAGLVIEAGLADLILEEVRGEPGPLPMISHALVETWKLRRGHRLTVDAYRSFGGVKRAIAATADEVFSKYTEAEREQVRDIFLRLTRVDVNDVSGGYRDTRQRVLLRDLIPAGGNSDQTERLLDKLVDARLIVKDMGRNSQVDVEVAHEALITHWDKLRGWLDENREGLLMHRHLTESTYEWERRGRETSELYRGARLKGIQKWVKEHSNQLSPLEGDFLKASQNVKKRERLRWVAVACVGVALLLTIVLAMKGQLNRFIYRPVDMDNYWATIPEGEFQMGSENYFDNEKPFHTVYLDAFEIGRYEVTNRQYAQCVKADVCTVPRNKLYSTQENGLYPITDVSWYEARTFCEWIGGRLPTEAEWEKAARGNLEGKTYPWGDEAPTCTKGALNGANFLDREGCSGETIPVGSFAPNYYGLYDMAGKVFELVNDWYLDTYYSQSPSENPTGPASGKYRVVRGGERIVEYRIEISHRFGFGPLNTNDIIGFRCARNIPVEVSP